MDIMLISGGDKDLWYYLSVLQDVGYTILRAFPHQESPSEPYPHCPWAWDWESLLGSREPFGFCQHLESGWVCTLCQPYGKSFDGRTFEDFTTHLKTLDHALCVSVLGSISMHLSLCNSLWFMFAFQRKYMLLFLTGCVHLDCQAGDRQARTHQGF